MSYIDYDKILEDIKPSQREQKRLESLSNNLMHIINELIQEKGLNAHPMLVGSLAKGTWLKGKGDIDILIIFPLETSLEKLKEWGLLLGRECIKRVGGQAEEKYASHPYITGHIEKYDVDFVPCYAIQDSSQLKSAVDRTILHTEYIKKNLKTSQKDQVILLKKFMESVNTYGSESKVGGFAGYLCELLILYYDSFLNVLEAAANEWHPGFGIDLQGHGTISSFNEPLVVVDPVDANRNVAASLSMQKLSEFIVASQNYLHNPSEKYFQPPAIETSPLELETIFNERGTKTFILKFKSPSIPSDALYPQIRKTEKSIVKILVNADFQVLGSGSWTDLEEVFILLEMLIWKLPPLRKHKGPTVWNKNHGQRFRKKHEAAWVEEENWMALRRREHSHAESLIQKVCTSTGINNMKVGKHLKKEILRNYNLQEVQKIIRIYGKKEEFLHFLHGYLHKNEFLER